jgi:hypothetical protein
MESDSRVLTVQAWSVETVKQREQRSSRIRGSAFDTTEVLIPRSLRACTECIDTHQHVTVAELM